MTALRIVFAGTPDFGLPCLEALHASHHQLVALYTQPDRPAGRGQKLHISAVKEWGLQHDIVIHQPLNFKSPESIATLAALEPDLMIVIAYGLILPKSILSIPRLGCVNVHASLLPRWRGASPIQQAILAGDKETGITIMQMDVGMDTGDMLMVRSCNILDTDTTTSLQYRLSALATDPLLQTIDALGNAQALATPQSTDGVTYAPKIKKQDAAINWHQPATQIDCQIRGYYPWPIAYTQIGDLIVRIHQATIVQSFSQQRPGTILNISSQGLVVQAGQGGAIALQIWQYPGGRPMSITDHLNAQRSELAVGMVFNDL